MQQSQPEKKGFAKRIEKDLQDDRILQLTDKSMQVQLQIDLLIASDYSKLPANIIPLEGNFKYIQFQFIILFNKNYPFVAPDVKCVNNIRHPNIDIMTNRLYIETINANNWIPTNSLFDVLKEIKHVLLNVNLSYVPKNQFNIKYSQQFMQQKQQIESLSEDTDEEQLMCSKQILNNFEMDDNSDQEDQEESRLSSGKMEEEVVDDSNDTESDSKSVQLNFVDLSIKQNKRFLEDHQLESKQKSKLFP